MHGKSLRILMASFLSVLFGSANAAELSNLNYWNGFYVGGTLGGNWADSHYTGSPTGAWYFPAPIGEPTIVPNLSAVSSGSLSPGGVMGGGEVGYNWLLRSFVVGLEGDWSGWSVSRSTNSTGPGDPVVPGSTLTAATSVKSQWLATLRPRIGIMRDHWLLYATGGAAFSRVDFAQSVFFSASGSTQTGSGSSTLTGWVVGGGAEYAVTQHWSCKGEYLFVTLPYQHIQEVNTAFPGYNQSAKNWLRSSIFRFGVNYQFNL